MTRTPDHLREMDCTWQGRLDAYEASQRPGIFASWTEALVTLLIWFIVGAVLLGGVLFFGELAVKALVNGAVTADQAAMVRW
jgi:hypothetical protein